MKIPVPVIDLFAGPGGLGEGFSSIGSGTAFNIRLSIEMEEWAHKTLTLRSFYRQFETDKVPDQYYEFVSQPFTDVGLNQLLASFPEGDKARAEACRLTLGEDNEQIYEKLNKITEGFNRGQHWVLIGGPPCQAYSLAGRVRNQGKKDYKAENDHRHFLYKEYLQIIAKYHPSVFVMENVKGILSSNVNGQNIFDNITEDLRNPNDLYASANGSTAQYKLFSLVNSSIREGDLKPAEFIIKSEDFGIPQKRHRVIILGVRTDIDVVPETLVKKAHKISVNSAISDLPALRSGLSKVKNAGLREWVEAISDFPHIKKTDFTDPPDQLDELLRRIKASIFQIQSDSRNEMDNLQKNPSRNKVFKPSWFYNPRLKSICNHESRTHMKSDLHRYLFVSCFGELFGRSPKLSEFPEQLLPNHKNAKLLSSITNFVDRFKVQLSDKPSTTVTCHISKDGHYYIHPDPTQCRSLTVREAARLQTFPDDYFFCGPRTKQYHQVGNAVPPLLANKIAAIIKKLLDEADRDG
ncbi:DNA cytosine methyltransferase [Salinispira pacifica]|uniref:DNA (cytosine-5-)-methyltransferase n=1 Tax=Salinispira pacifica TaxID=1307761 RepID=V5WEP4_9SPIO|nr:DNA cytosine methyltransferase [Salinispira pacifica]AHC14095.1 Modification methylase [Salinispira pacifica]